MFYEFKIWRRKNKIYIKKFENFIAFILISFMCEFLQNNLLGIFLNYGNYFGIKIITQNKKGNFGEIWVILHLN